MTAVVRPSTVLRTTTVMSPVAPWTGGRHRPRKRRRRCWARAVGSGAGRGVWPGAARGRARGRGTLALGIDTSPKWPSPRRRADARCSTAPCSTGSRARGRWQFGVPHRRQHRHRGRRAPSAPRRLRPPPLPVTVGCSRRSSRPERPPSSPAARVERGGPRRTMVRVGSGRHRRHRPPGRHGGPEAVVDARGSGTMVRPADVVEGVQRRFTSRLHETRTAAVLGIALGVVVRGPASSPACCRT